jgi:hypothetical protein
MKLSIEWVLAMCCCALWGCSQAVDTTSDDGGEDDARDAGTSSSGNSGSSGGGAQPMGNGCDAQIANSTDSLPNDLACTGLYEDIASKKLASGMRAFTPAIPLWSDGSEKERWIYLPPGTKIDTSDMAQWVFPTGTKLFKQFSAGGKRIETRLYQKLATGDWSHATYIWDSAETTATRELGGKSVSVGKGGTFVGGSMYHVPTQRDCDQCHEGRAERVLGFEAISLGLAGASGLTLDALVKDKLLTDPPAKTQLVIGDDGSGMAPEVLGWMHINCGVSCHNDRPASEAYQTLLRLRLDPAQLDGRSSRTLEPETSTIGAPAKSTRFVGQTRIVRGSPTQSLLYQLITSRAGKTKQMPPLATTAVDTEHANLIKDWITKMGPSF